MTLQSLAGLDAVSCKQQQEWQQLDFYGTAEDAYLIDRDQTTGSVFTQSTSIPAHRVSFLHTTS